MLKILIVTLALLATPVWALEPLKENPKVAFFGIVFIDTSTEGAYFGVQEEETQRLAMITEYVRENVTDKGFELLDLSPVETEINRVVSMADCYGCEVRAAQKLGADYSLVGEVQKVSTLIQSMNLVLRDAGTGQMVRGRSVDIRNNSDEAWIRGMRYILRTNFFKE